MSSSLALRRLFSYAIPPATATATAPLCPFTKPALNLSNKLTSITPQIQPRRPLSQTALLFSSPFRLTSHPTPDATPTQPESQPQDHPAFETDPDIYYSPYKPKRQWPPDMSKLSPKHQFRLERKYRRRAALKYARPKWSKATKLVQWGSIFFVLLYAMLFMEWDDKGSPFDEIRKFVFSSVKGAFSTPPPPRPVGRSNDEPMIRE